MTLQTDKYRHIINLAIHDVQAMFAIHISDKIVYHTFTHTEKVVKRAKRIADTFKLNAESQFVIELASWYHDTGYLFQPSGHEAVSARKASEFLRTHAIADDIISRVEHCILATCFPQIPENDEARILCDADMGHLANEDFFNISILLWYEFQRLNDKRIDLYMYWLQTLQVFDAHSYFTTYGQQVMQVRKMRNREKLENILRQKGLHP